MIEGGATTEPSTWTELGPLLSIIITWTMSRSIACTSSLATTDSST